MVRGRPREVGRLNRLFTPELVAKAFGRIDQPGDEATISQLASGVVLVFSSMLQWGRQVRSVVVEPRFQPVYLAMSNLVRQPLAQISDFVIGAERDSRVIAEDLAQGRPLQLNRVFT
jgi:hypothetical protein